MTMVLHGYTVSESALLEAFDPYKLRAIVQHHIRVGGGADDKWPFLKNLNEALTVAGFTTVHGVLFDAVSGMPADEFDDEVVLVVDTDVVHHLTRQ